MSFQRPARPPAKQIGPGYTLRARTGANGQGLVSAVSIARASVPLPTKTPERVSNAIRKSAKGEECTVRIAGVCTGDPETTIWSHAPLGAAGKGRSLKSLDLCGCYSCTACDSVVDGQVPMPAGYTRQLVLLDWMFGHMRSLVKLRQKGLV